MIVRCSWANLKNKNYLEYHDKEWGVPEYDDRKLFEMMILEGMQAGLSWSTILNKRINLRQAFDNFSPARIVNYDNKKINQLLKNPGIIRNRRKITAVVKNAKAYLKIKNEYGRFAKYIWQFVGEKPIINCWNKIEDIPVNSPQSDAMSKDLKKRGFGFVGSTICYAFMQAVGMVNDHTTDCYRYNEIISKYGNLTRIKI
jgi:DNA-3-methyladenine glycosylase I